MQHDISQAFHLQITKPKIFTCSSMTSVSFRLYITKLTRKTTTKIYTQFFIPHILHSLPSVPPQRSCGRGQRSKSMGSPDLWSWSRCIPCDFQSPSLARLHPLLRPLCTGPQRHLVVATPPKEKNENPVAVKNEYKSEEDLFSEFLNLVDDFPCHSLIHHLLGGSRVQQNEEGPTRVGMVTRRQRLCDRVRYLRLKTTAISHT